MGIFNIETIDLIGGNLPRKELRLVEAWAEVHQNELIENWGRLQTGRLPYRIASLR